jgi:bacteriorhodopsin
MSGIGLSTNLSILVQIITGAIGFEGIQKTLSENHQILSDLLKLETIVQFVELFFYIVILSPMTSAGLPQMAAARYMDWVITTPTMLLTTIIFFKYEEYLETKSTNNLVFFEYIQKNITDIIFIVVCNFCMLLCGYLGEVGILDTNIALALGFVFFGMTFYFIYTKYAKHSNNGSRLFYYISTIWGMYGIAAFMSTHTKNNMYNILDIFAKNFFGIYLYYRISIL